LEVKPPTGSRATPDPHTAELLRVAPHSGLRQPELRSHGRGIDKTIRLLVRGDEFNDPLSDGLHELGVGWSEHHQSSHDE
jgi:hypothetical protein